jgi:hypothetical protein
MIALGNSSILWLLWWRMGEDHEVLSVGIKILII